MGDAVGGAKRPVEQHGGAAGGEAYLDVVDLENPARSAVKQG